MTLFKMLWLRRLVRRNTNPIPYKTARTWREKLSLGYMIIAWNAFGLVCYMAYEGKVDWARYYGVKSEEEARLPPARSFARQFEIDQAKVFRVSGLKYVGSYEIDNVQPDSDDEQLPANDSETIR